MYLKSHEPSSEVGVPTQINIMLEFLTALSKESLIKKYGKDVRVNVQTGELSFPTLEKV